MKLYSLIFVGLLTGCGSVHNLGHIGGTEFYAIKSRSLQGPNFTALAIKDESGVTSVHTVIGGPGIGQSVIAAGGQIGGAAVLRPSNSQTTVTASGSGNSGNSLSGSSARAGSDSIIENSGNSTTTGTGNTVNNGAHDNTNGNSNH